MFRFRQLVLAFSLTASLASAGTASADPVQIESGRIVVDGVQDVMSRGFLRSITYELVTDFFTIEWGDSDFFTQDPLSPSFPRPTMWTGPDGSTMLAFLDFASVLIEATPSTSPLPFSMTGTFRIVDESGATLFDGDVFGSGQATWRFVTAPGGGEVVSTGWFEFYETSPAPEPATLLLLGSGVIGVMIRRRLHP
jgi:hypothetical protein